MYIKYGECTHTRTRTHTRTHTHTHTRTHTHTHTLHNAANISYLMCVDFE